MKKKIHNIDDLKRIILTLKKKIKKLHYVMEFLTYYIQDTYITLKKLKKILIYWLFQLHQMKKL